MEKYGRARQDTGGNIIRRARIACWITKAISAHSEYVILFLLHGINGYANATQYYVIRTLPVLYCFVFGIFKSRWLLYVSPRLTLRKSSLPTEGIFVCSIDTRTVTMYLYIINWLVSVTEAGCLMSGTTESVNMLEILGK